MTALILMNIILSILAVGAVLAGAAVAFGLRSSHDEGRAGGRGPSSWGRHLAAGRA